MIIEFNPAVMFLFFIDNLGFISSGYLVKEFAKILGEVAKVMLELGWYSAVIYNILKIKVVFFFKLHHQ